MKSAEAAVSDPIIKAIKFKHGSLDMPYSMRTSASSSVAEVTPNDCTAHAVCDSFDDPYGTAPCKDCYNQFIQNGCGAPQAQFATDNLLLMNCCTESCLDCL